MTASNDPGPLGPAAAGGSDAARSDGDPDALRAEIEATRADLADAVTELAARTDVKARAHDAVDNAKAYAHNAVDSAKAYAHDAVSSAIDSVKDAAATAAGAVIEAGAAAGHGVAAVAHKAKDVVGGTDSEPPATDGVPPTP